MEDEQLFSFLSICKHILESKSNTLTTKLNKTGWNTLTLSGSSPKKSIPVYPCLFKRHLPKKSQGCTSKNWEPPDESATWHFKTWPKLPCPESQSESSESHMTAFQLQPPEGFTISFFASPWNGEKIQLPNFRRPWTNSWIFQSRHALSGGFCSRMLQLHWQLPELFG